MVGGWLTSFYSCFYSNPTMTKITILTGPVHTGKSTVLMQWVLKQQEAGKIVRGLLNPSIDGCKHFIHARHGDKVNMHASEEEANPIVIGKYRFSNKAFNLANQWIQEESTLGSDIFVLDEIGKLELSMTGLWPGVEALLSNQALHKHIILVIRDYLLKQATETHSLQHARIIKPDDLQ